MIKTHIIHAQLSHALAMARHKDAIVICDASMPIPRECPVIDLSLVRGVPTLPQTVAAILSDLVAESYQVFELMPQYNPDMYHRVQAMLPHLPGSTISQEQLTQLMLRAQAVVRTGDVGSCCTMVLYSASGMDKYVRQFDRPLPTAAEG